MIVWALEYEIDRDAEVVGIFDDADKAKSHVPEATWEETKVGYEAPGQHDNTTWYLMRYELNTYKHPTIAPYQWDKL